MKRVAIVGGGAAGFFTAVCLKERLPQAQVTIFEQKQHVLAKVKVSGGGRCNCTNTFAGVSPDLKGVYPRGFRLMKRLLKGFSQHDTFQWFQLHDVPLTVQDDQCVFPASQSSLSVVNCLLGEARRLGVEIRTGCRMDIPDEFLHHYDDVVLTTGGAISGASSLLSWLADRGHTVVTPLPSLFTLRIADEQLQQLMGTVVESATVYIPSTNFRSDGPLLITHWGISGPAVLKLSSYAARHLADCNYMSPIAVNWLGLHEDEVHRLLSVSSQQHPHRQLTTINPFALPARLWEYLVTKTLPGRADAPWGSLNKKEANRLVNTLCGGDHYLVSGRAPFRDEFVTCGGVGLDSVDPATLQSRVVPHLYFAGELLDIDGITGGFNLQAAWTTAYTVAQSL